MRHFLVALVLTSAINCGLHASAAAAAGAQTHGSRPRTGEALLAAHAPTARGFTAPDRMVVRFRGDFARAFDLRQQVAPARTGVPAVDALLERHGVVGLRELFRGTPSPDMAKLALPDMSGFMEVTIDLAKTTLVAALDGFANDPTVLAVEPINIEPIDDVPNDPEYGSQWALNQFQDHDIDAPEAFVISRGQSSITVAVLDTGVRYFHADLGGVSASLANPEFSRGNMAVNMTERNGAPGVDDDMNGFVDDWMGWDFISAFPGAWPGEDSESEDNDPRDFHGHGTHCAGIVGAINNNGFGIASPGGGWNSGSQSVVGNGVRILPLRVGGSGIDANGNEGGFVDLLAAAEALHYAANNHAQIANLSFRTSNTSGLGAAVDYFLAAGGIVFHAAGNNNSSIPDYLCSRPDVFNVAALDINDSKASFSNYGPFIDISAPGLNIRSTFHDRAHPAADAFAFQSGTSMAAPLVAGIAANVWSQYPFLTPSQVWDDLVTTADDIDAANPTFVGQLGAGRVNLRRALDDSAGYSFGNPLVFTTGNFVFDSTNAYETDFWMGCDQYGDGHREIFNTVFISYTPAVSGPCTINTCGTTWDTKVLVRRSHVWIVCNDDGGCTQPRASSVTFDATEGQEYTIAVGGYSPTDRGIGTISISQASASICSNAKPVEGDDAFSTIGATGSVLACDQYGEGSPLIYNPTWFRYTASGSGNLILSTCNGADFDTKIAVFEGGCSGPLVACNDDAPECGLQSTVTFQPVCGTTYAIAIGGYAPGVTGRGTLLLYQFGNCSSCTGDLDGDHTVGASDLSLLLSTWGTTDVSTDIDHDGTVGASDLSVLLDAWGSCP